LGADDPRRGGRPRSPEDLALFLPASRNLFLHQNL
jgi:hypothetical protein